VAVKVVFRATVFVKKISFLHVSIIQTMDVTQKREGLTAVVFASAGSLKAEKAKANIFVMMWTSLPVELAVSRNCRFFGGS